MSHFHFEAKNIRYFYCCLIQLKTSLISTFAYTLRNIKGSPLSLSFILFLFASLFSPPLQEVFPPPPFRLTDHIPYPPILLGLAPRAISIGNTISSRYGSTVVPRVSRLPYPRFSIDTLKNGRQKEREEACLQEEGQEGLIPGQFGQSQRRAGAQQGKQ